MTHLSLKVSFRRRNEIRDDRCQVIPVKRVSNGRLQLCVCCDGHYLRAFPMHLPAALHLAGVGQPLHGLKAGFFIGFFISSDLS
jgi:hypothetical protein